MGGKVLQIEPGDDLVVALSDLPAGEVIAIDGISVQLEAHVPAKHKVAVRDLAPGDPVRMYGVTVGRTTRAIPCGGLASTENLQNDGEPYRVRPGTPTWVPPDVAPWRDRTFHGYHRDDGRVGTANYWIVVPLVFCENRNVHALRRALGEALGYEFASPYAAQVERLAALYRSGADLDDIRSLAAGERSGAGRRNRLFPNVDGIKFLTHDGGCGGTPEDAAMLTSVLAAYIDHPNVGGATVLSLGCQNVQVSMLQQALAARNPDFNKPLVLLEQQSLGTEDALMRRAVTETFVGMARINAIERRPAPMERLVVGVECGGSDGFSGVSANPAIGHAADLLVALGGSVVLSEFPELCGVEQALIDRCVSESVAARFIALQEAYARRARAVGATFDMNPSVGNVRDGLLTDAMKSAGAVRKGGSSPVVKVLDYGESVRQPGLSLLCTPGNDVESTTGLAAAGATVILFSTGLGTPTGNPIVPTIKVSSNSSLFQRMPDIIDVDAGPILTGSASVADIGGALLKRVAEAGSGAFVPAAVRLQQDDFLPWKRGISL